MRELQVEVVEKTLKCGNVWCGKSLSSTFYYERHLKICNLRTKKSFPCSSCSRVFNRAYHLQRHKKSHIMKPLYSCADCSNIYVQKDKYDCHKMNCQGAVTQYSPLTMVYLPSFSQ